MNTMSQVLYEFLLVYLFIVGGIVVFLSVALPLAGCVLLLRAALRAIMRMLDKLRGWEP